ncbi:periplasmic protein involved in polysaccharide export [Synechococcus sp. PCC 7502]|uniref:SLBB domain-containing protein n=1 Tax=Synechococcus sp. PCC 7502 TaxID=1173263 RepID=UPI00029FCBB1|nr:SLBB domain-containing protein [Synechococcus sp. PCC 7502]AFY74822.1 periplasmic protein involved in polysaccharide export [Synechococcus sp. PCC 7502]
MNKYTYLTSLVLATLPIFPSSTTAQPVVPLGTPTTPAALNSNFNPLVNVTLPEDIGKYTLGAGDGIQIAVFNVPELSGTQTIAPDGTITLALIGGIKISGLTIEETARLLEKKLAPYLVRKIVNVVLVQPRPLNIAIVGEVNRPGTRIIQASSTGSSNTQATTLTSAINLAGGVTQQADVSNIQVSRLAPGGQRRIIKADLLNLLRQGDINQDLKLLDGDSIFVPGLSDPTATQPRQVGAASFAPDTFSIQIAVSGEVNRTGPQTLTYSRNGGALVSAVGQTAVSNLLPTLTRALQQAGGITQRADVRNIKIIRSGVGGERIVINANLWELIDKGDLAQDIRLIDGDSVVVSIAQAPNTAEFGQIAKAVFSPSVINVRVVGEAKSPGTITLTPNAPFTEAIAAVGGLTSDADWRSVELYRINPDGSLTQRKLVANLSSPANEDTNPSLRDRDVIVIRTSFGASLLNSAQKAVNLIAPFITLSNLFNKN